MRSVSPSSSILSNLPVWQTIHRVYGPPATHLVQKQEAEISNRSPMVQRAHRVRLRAEVQEGNAERQRGLTLEDTA